MKTTDYPGVFPARLRELMDLMGTTQKALAAAVGKRPQTVSLWLLGETLPDIASRTAIADFFQVSADYLLGRTDTLSLDLDIQSITEKTALSETAVLMLIESKRLDLPYMAKLMDDIIRLPSEVTADYAVLTQVSKNSTSAPKSIGLEELAKLQPHQEALEPYGETIVSKRDYMRYLSSEIGTAITEALRERYIPEWDK